MPGGHLPGKVGGLKTHGSIAHGMAIGIMVGVVVVGMAMTGLGEVEAIETDTVVMVITAMILGVTVVMDMIEVGDIMGTIGGVVTMIMIMVKVMATDMKPHPLTIEGNMTAIRINTNIISGIDSKQEINGNEILGGGMRHPGHGVTLLAHPIRRLRMIRLNHGVLTHKV